MVTRFGRKNSGFTLIELMLATSLLMLVMFSGYYAYSLYTQKWQKRVQGFWHGTEQAIALDVINKMLVGTNPYVVKGKNGKPCIYFIGDSTRLRFVTDSPIYGEGSSLVELELKLSDSTNKRYQLVYKEYGLEGSTLLYLPQKSDEINWWKKSVLFSNLIEFKWSYFGWSSYGDVAAQTNLSENGNNQDTRQWYTKHDANLIRVLPINIQLDMVTGVSAQQHTQTSQLLISLPNNSIYKLTADTRVDA